MLENGRFTEGFDRTSRYINPEGLSGTELPAFRTGLKRLFNTTPHGDESMWQPGQCSQTARNFPAAQEVFGTGLELGLSFEAGHFWYKLRTKNSIIVIDPAGLPKDEDTAMAINLTMSYDPKNTHHTLENFLHLYEPYFGRLDKASGYPQKVYSEGSHSLRRSRTLGLKALDKVPLEWLFGDT